MPQMYHVRQCTESPFFVSFSLSLQAVCLYATACIAATGHQLARVTTNARDIHHTYAACSTPQTHTHIEPQQCIHRQQAAPIHAIHTKHGCRQIACCLPLSMRPCHLRADFDEYTSSWNIFSEVNVNQFQYSITKRKISLRFYFWRARVNSAYTQFSISLHYILSFVFSLFPVFCSVKILTVTVLYLRLDSSYVRSMCGD